MLSGENDKKGMIRQLEMNLKIDPEFQEKIPPLTEAEFKQLEENIMSDGEVYVPIVTWNGTIVDGHNRWVIVQKHPGIPYKTKEMDFADKWQAFDWMYGNQLGRRNLTLEQKTYLIGKQYEARKHTHGGTGANQYTVLQSDQSGHTAHGRIRDQIAKEHGIGQGTVQRAEIYAKGIDAIRESEPELADKILKSEANVSKTAVQIIGTANSDERSEMIQAVKEGKKTVEKRDRKEIHEDRERIKQIKKDIEASRTVEPYIPNIDDLIEELRDSFSMYIKTLNITLSNYSKVIKGNSEMLVNLIDECITRKIEKIKEGIINEYA